MKAAKLILLSTILIAVLSPTFPTLSQATPEEEIFEKIRLLEVQIQELKAMKAQQNKTEEKNQQCVKAVGSEKFCTCLAEALPEDIGFEQYVRVILAPTEASNDPSRKPTEKKSVDAIRKAREKCVSKGYF